MLSQIGREGGGGCHIKIVKPEWGDLGELGVENLTYWDRLGD